MADWQTIQDRVSTAVFGRVRGPWDAQAPEREREKRWRRVNNTRAFLGLVTGSVTLGALVVGYDTIAPELRALARKNACDRIEWVVRFRPEFLCGNVLALLKAGGDALKKGDFEQAKRSFSLDDRGALYFDPALVEAWAGLGHVARRQKDFLGSLRYYDRALDIDNTYGDALRGRATSLVALGEFTAARWDYDRIVALTRTAEAYAERGAFFKERNELDFAYDDFRTAANKVSSYAVKLVEVGRLQEIRGDRSAALRSFDAAGRADPKLTAAHNGSARVLLADERPEAALVKIDAALKADPRNGEALALERAARQQLRDRSRFR